MSLISSRSVAGSLAISPREDWLCIARREEDDTHRVPLEKAEEETTDTVQEPDETLGPSFQMNR